MSTQLARIFYVASAALLGYAIHEKRRPKRIFVSYFYKDELSIKRMLRLWDLNKNIDFRIDDRSTDVSIPSDDEEYIKSEIENSMKKCDFVLVLLGKKTHKRLWVIWEIELAKKLGIPIIAVKKEKSNVSPKQLKSSGVTWVYGFKLKKIQEAVSGL